MSEIIVDTRKLDQYAQRISQVNTRVRRLDSRIDSLYFKVQLKDIQTLRQADALIHYSRALKKCCDYLRDTADDFEKAENLIRKTDPEKLAKRYSVEHAVVDFLQRVISKAPGKINSIKDAFDFLDVFYNELPDEIKLALKVFVPDTVQEAYMLASGIFQGDLTFREGWELTKSILSENLTAAIICETLEYVFVSGADRIADMENEVYEKFEKGDILGGILAMGEGFVDTVIGGAIEVGGNVLGDYVDDNLLDYEDAKVLYTLNKTYQYHTGLQGQNDDEGYSMGGLIKEGFKTVADDLDRLTDGDPTVLELHKVNSRLGYLAI